MPRSAPRPAADRHAPVEPAPTAHYHLVLTGRRRSKSRPMTQAEAERELRAVRRDLESNPLGRVLSFSPIKVTGYLARVGGVEALIVGPCTDHCRG